LCTEWSRFFARIEGGAEWKGRTVRWTGRRPAAQDAADVRPQPLHQQWPGQHDADNQLIADWHDWVDCSWTRPEIPALYHSLKRSAGLGAPVPLLSGSRKRTGGARVRRPDLHRGKRFEPVRDLHERARALFEAARHRLRHEVSGASRSPTAWTATRSAFKRCPTKPSARPTATSCSRATRMRAARGHRRWRPLPQVCDGDHAAGRPGG
jgi:hypothetical protein